MVTTNVTDSPSATPGPVKDTPPPVEATEELVREKLMHVNLAGLIAFSLLLGFALSQYSEPGSTNGRNALLRLMQVNSHNDECSEHFEVEG